MNKNPSLPRVQAAPGLLLSLFALTHPTVFGHIAATRLPALLVAAYFSGSAP